MLISKTGKEIKEYWGSFISGPAIFGCILTDEVEFYVGYIKDSISLEKSNLIATIPYNSKIHYWDQKKEIYRRYWNDPKIPEDIQEEIRKCWNAYYANVGEKI